MFQNAFQSGAFLEVFDAKVNREKDKVLNNLIKIVNPQSVQKVYDKVTKGYIYDIEGTRTKLQFPKDDKQELALIQHYLVFQIYIPQGSALSIEVTTTDTNKNKRRINFTSNVKEIDKNYFHSKIPFDIAKRGVWLNLSFDILSFFELFKDQTFRSVDSFVITGAFKLRKIFTMRSPLVELSAEDEFEGMINPDAVLVPKTQNFPSGVSYCNQLITLAAVKKYIEQKASFAEMMSVDQPLENTQPLNPSNNKYLQVKSATVTTKDPKSRLHTTTGSNARTISKNEERIGVKKRLDTGTSPDPLRNKTSKDKENLDASPQPFKAKKNNLVDTDRFEQSRSDFEASSDLMIRGGLGKTTLTSNNGDYYPISHPFEYDPHGDSRAESSGKKLKPRRMGSVDMAQDLKSTGQRLSTKTRENPYNATQTTNTSATTNATRKTRKDTTNEERSSSRGHSHDSTLKPKTKLFKGAKPYNLELTMGSRMDTSTDIDSKITPTYKAKKQNPWADNENSLKKKVSRQNLHSTLNKEEMKSIDANSNAKNSKNKSPLKPNNPKSTLKPSALIKGNAMKKINTLNQSPKAHNQPPQNVQQVPTRQVPYSDPRAKFSSLTRNGKSAGLPSTLEVEGDEPSHLTRDDIESIEENLEFDNHSMKSSTVSHKNHERTEERKEFIETNKRSINELLLNGNQYQKPDFADLARREGSQIDLDDSLHGGKDFRKKPEQADSHQKKKNNIEEQLNQFVNKVRPFSPPFSSAMMSTDNQSTTITRKNNEVVIFEHSRNDEAESAAKTDGANGEEEKTTAKGGEQNEEMLEVLYDPILNCYYNPKTNAYYELNTE